ncbi:MAG: YgiQ family radical SAM protein [Mucinivorans sp.]
MQNTFLPTSAKEVAALGWDSLDVILFTGDAYIDHPAFGAAVIGRTLQAAGYRVAIVPQPDWRGDWRDFKKLGVPRLFFGVTAGAMDSTVNHYTPTLRLRSDDAYTPDNRAGARPDYPTIVYTKILKELYPSTPVVLGGIEASLRRLTHYDYLQDRLRPSFLVESGADLLIYGMGEKAIVDVARALENRLPTEDIPQTVRFTHTPPTNIQAMHSYEECVANSKKFAANFVAIETASNMASAPVLVEPYKDGAMVVNPPYPTFTTEDCDATYDLPYMRSPAPRYRGKTIAAWEMIKFSINSHRGCYGGCSFCAISMHQGKFIASRSKKSIVSEVEKVSGMEDFRGTITDVGGPSANMWQTGGRKKDICAKCRRASCLFPKICVNLNNDHAPILELYKAVGAVRGVKHTFVGSGIRYDMFDKTDYFETVIVHHTSGRFKVAPEHTEDAVLALMRKPSFTLFEKMRVDFDRICAKNNLRYELIPYFISAHPGCGEQQMRALKTKTHGVMTNQVQDFTPTPMTLSSVMFYTGQDPYTGQKLYVARDKASKDKQKSYFFDHCAPTNRSQNNKWQKKQ